MYIKNKEKKVNFVISKFKKKKDNNRRQQVKYSSKPTIPVSSKPARNPHLYYLSFTHLLFRSLSTNL